MRWRTGNEAPVRGKTFASLDTGVGARAGMERFRVRAHEALRKGESFQPVEERE